MKNIYPFVLLLLLSGCGEVYIPDPVELRIPKYSEDGNQVAGAIINGESWKTELGCGFLKGCNFPLQISSFPIADSLIIILYGDLQEGLNKGKPISINFVLKNQSIEDFWDLLQLKDGLFIVNGTDVLATTGNFDISHDCMRGQILFREVKHIASNGDEPRIILAGTFGLECDQNGELITIYKGRFDFSLERGYVYFH